IAGVDRASLWSGTAASWVDLNPVGATQSVAGAASATQQGGWAAVGGVFQASLWSGTAASWTSLHPAGATISGVFGMAETHQVGYARIGNVDRAGIWSGTAASWEDLSLALPTGFTWSYVQGIFDDGTTIYVAGSGFNIGTGREEALLWTRPIPTPGASLVMGLGALLAARRHRR
ncbi:MAG: hypothetical protein ACOYN0_17510, partial [Phycisphaerales bacterium]